MPRTNATTRTVAFRLDESEYRLLAKAAQQQEQSAGTHARALVRDGLNDSATIKLLDEVDRLREAVADLAAELRAVAIEVVVLRVLLCRSTEVLLSDAGRVDQEAAAEWVRAYLRREGGEPCSP